MKTLVLSNLQGLTQLWKNETVKVANSVDKVLIAGNIVSLMPTIKDGAQKGPNITMLRLATTYIDSHDDGEILVGPNEIVAISNPRVWVNDRSLAILRERWLETPQLAMKTATVLNGRLVTHGGLTHGEWLAIGAPENVYDAEKALNAKYFGKLFTDSCYSIGGRPNYAADPIFAHPFKEFYPSWLTSNDEMPFGQILGSRSLGSEEGREAMGSTENPLQYLSKVSLRKFGSIAYVNGQEITSIGHKPRGAQIRALPETESYYIEKS